MECEMFKTIPVAMGMRGPAANEDYVFPAVRVFAQYYVW
ncbi:hypothetical protein GAP227_03 [Cronobacter phage vB_CskP_GAP227]|jgi:hypothetical protein|uniref:Uncharacterized protein n=1 Tax=Cronobacter phage vB_CskP_GAP227 TaxID=1264737 RepID=K9S119_9CAUD|nr:hypothetical protein GAP227_03 [Cronobacter phage vB_CskP_GAP227]AFY63120.1 hypothetical protein GAP227_03 [Cronobacter phage vB_CskP_GAP227]